jgi:ABC-type Fe3+ transport system substrate-binding protein
MASGALGCRSRSREVVVYLSIDQVFTEPILRDFERQSGVRVRAVFDTEETKSTGVLNRIIAEARSPQADVFWSGDPVCPQLLVKRGLVRAYVSPEAAAIPPAFKAADGTWTGGAARARLLLVNETRVKPDDMPRSVRDLADPKWKGQTAIANPLFGTTTMHVAALADAWGDYALKAFLTQLKANGCRIASSNGEVKRLVASGEVAFGLADTDAAAEALRDGAPIEVVYPDQDGMGTLLMPTAVVPLARRYSTRAGSSTWAASTTSGPGPTSPSRGASSRHLTDARDLPHLLDVGEGSAMETHRIPACNVSSALRQRTPLRCRASHAVSRRAISRLERPSALRRDTVLDRDRGRRGRPAG